MYVTKRIKSPMSFSELVYTLLATKSLRGVFAAIVGFMSYWIMPVSHFIFAGFVLVIADWATGVTAARKRGEKITSNGFRRTLTKAVSYMGAILLSRMCEEVFLPAAPLTYVVASYIGLTEFKSVIENISIITDNDLTAALRIFKFFNKSKTNVQIPEPEGKEGDSRG